jgi:multimeric flavodoxin WrbA
MTDAAATHRKHLLAVYASQTGRTQQLLQAALDGAAELGDEIETRVRHGLAGTVDDLLWANALLLATPENFGTMAGALKDFFDRTYYPVEGKVDGLPYLLLVSAGNDGRGAVREVERIATGYRWNRVAEALIVRESIDQTALISAHERGQLLAAGLSIGSF